MRARTAATSAAKAPPPLHTTDLLRAAPLCTVKPASEGVLSIMYQRSSTGTTPSPIRVVDFQLE
jgi:hypothetical protein